MDKLEEKLIEKSIEAFINSLIGKEAKTNRAQKLVELPGFTSEEKKQMKKLGISPFLGIGSFKTVLNNYVDSALGDYLLKVLNNGINNAVSVTEPSLVIREILQDEEDENEKDKVTSEAVWWCLGLISENIQNDNNAK